MFVFRKVLPLEFTHFSGALQGTSCKGRPQLLASHRQVSRVKSCDQKMSGSDSGIRMVGELPIFVDPASTGPTGWNWCNLQSTERQGLPSSGLTWWGCMRSQNASMSLFDKSNEDNSWLGEEFQWTSEFVICPICPRVYIITKWYSIVKYIYR